MALEEVLKHEKSESGFVVEISENDADHKEIMKMVLSPPRRGMFITLVVSLLLCQEVWKSIFQ
jgi:hypothetical protein